MIYVLIYLLGVVSIENLARKMTTVDLLERPRNWFKAAFPRLGKLATCRLCQGFWMSMMFGIIYPVGPFMELFNGWAAWAVKVPLIWLSVNGFVDILAEAVDRYLNRAPSSNFLRAIVKMETKE